jgi:hypothetical protein
MSDAFDHERLKVLAKSLNRPMSSVFVLHHNNDPFMAGVPARRAMAEWFGGLWERFELKTGVHDRRIHYLLVCQPEPILLPDGQPYLNTEKHFDQLTYATRDARYLGFVPMDAIVDRRNPEPKVYLLHTEESAARIGTWEGHVTGTATELTEPKISLPSLSFHAPVISQRYHLEVVCEKSTMNDVLMPFGERLGVNVVTCIGEISLPRCRQIIQRVQASGKPGRILYLSDFDPGGQSMPVGAARKIEFVAQNRGLDIQLRTVVLTHEQCVEFQLPRTPLKETETRAAKFEERFGEGGTELDALEALHPGELERILTGEVERYYDRTLDRRVRRQSVEVELECRRITRSVRERHAEEIAALEAAREEIVAEVERMRERIAELEFALEAEAEPLFETMTEELEAEAPDVDHYEWPEPKDADEDPDPLFDSTRDYLDQVERYKAQQGKRIELLQPRKYKRVTATCTNPSCRKQFEAVSRNASQTCSPRCREAVRRLKAAKPPIPCAVCGKLFHSIRGATVCNGRDCQNAQRRRKRARG